MTLEEEIEHESEERSKETCMCGEPVKGGEHDNHYPISQFDYANEAKLFGSLLKTENGNE